MKKTLLFVAVAVVLFCGGGMYMMRGAAAAKAAAARASAGAPQTVQRGDLVVSVVDTGTIDAVNAVEIKSRVSGRLARLLVDEGDEVKVGQVIATIDPLETQLKVAQDQAQLNGARSETAKAAVEIAQRRISAKADYDQAVSRLARVKAETAAQPQLTNAAIAQAQADLNRSLRDRENIIATEQPNARTVALSNQREAGVTLTNKQQELQRLQGLLEKGYVARRDVESAQLEVDLARSKLDAANQTVSRLDRQFSLERAKADESVRQAQAALQTAQVNSVQNGVKREEYRQAIGDVDKARAALRDVEVLMHSRDHDLATVAQLDSVLGDSKRQLRETEIRSPITGVVTKKMLKEGELASGLSSFSPGTSIVRIEDRTSLRVKLDVNEIDVAKMTEGMKARVEVDAIPNREFTGYVKRIAPASNDLGTTTGGASDNVVKYEVEIRLTDTAPQLRSGMSAKCTLDVIRHHNVLTLPKDYVDKQGPDYFVELAPAKPGGAPERKKITVPAESGAKVEVVGLAEGQKVVRPAFSGPPRKGMMQNGGGD